MKLYMSGLVGLVAVYERVKRTVDIIEGSRDLDSYVEELTVVIRHRDGFVVGELSYDGDNWYFTPDPEMIAEIEPGQLVNEDHPGNDGPLEIIPR